MLPHYSGNPVGHNGEGLSCDQFCEIVDNSVEQFKWTDHDAYSYAVQAFTSPANEFTLTDTRTWPSPPPPYRPACTETPRPPGAAGPG